MALLPRDFLGGFANGEGLAQRRRREQISFQTQS
jgi:hypothetical protein